MSVDLLKEAEELETLVAEFKGGNRARIEDLAQKVASVAGEVQAALTKTEQLHAETEQNRAYIQTVENKINGLDQMIAAVKGMASVIKEEGLSGQVAPPASAPAPEPQVITLKSLTELPNGHYFEDLPQEGFEQDPNILYRMGPGDHRAASVNIITGALYSMECSMKFRGKHRVLIDANAVVRKIGEMTKWDSPEVWRRLEAGLLPYLTVGKPNEFASMPVDGVSTGTETVQRTLYLDEIKYIRYLLLSLRPVLAKELEKMGAE
ncbi:MAG: hypothetical protein AAFU68_02995 [Pseudomonadota bacterium]